MISILVAIGVVLLALILYELTQIDESISLSTRSILSELQELEQQNPGSTFLTDAMEEDKELFKD